MTSAGCPTRADLPKHGLDGGLAAGIRGASPLCLEESAHGASWACLLGRPGRPVLLGEAVALMATDRDEGLSAHGFCHGDVIGREVAGVSGDAGRNGVAVVDGASQPIGDALRGTR